MTSADVRATSARRIQSCALLLILACGLFAAWSAAGFWGYTVDDAYISIRYADNLVHGHGLVWNPGEHVEGFSNPTWVLVLAGALWLGLDPMVAGKVLGLGFWAGAVVLAGFGARRLVRPSGAAGHLATVAGAAFLAVSYPGVFWSSQNLETPFYAFLLVAALVRLQGELRSGGAPLSAGLAGLAAISRPEAPLIVFPLVVARAVHAWRTRAWASAAAWAAVFTVPTLGYLAFRLATYGEVVPNTYFHKGARASWAEVWAYVHPWLATERAFVGAALLGGVALWLLRPRTAGLVSGVLAAGAFFVVWVGGDWMPNVRFVVPVLPVLALATGAGWAVLAERSGRFGLLAAGTLAGLVAFQAAQSVPIARADRSPEGVVEHQERADGAWGFGTLGEPFRGSNASVATWLLTRVPPDAVLAYSEIGLTGYAGGWEVLDLIGLTSKEMVGRTGLDTEGKMVWVRAAEPDWIVLKHIGPPQIRLLHDDPWLASTYVLEEGPKGLVVGRHRNAAGITDAQILQNLERATRLCPRVLDFQREHVRWTAALGDRAAREASCERVADAFPDAGVLLKRCASSVEAGGPRPRAPEAVLEPAPVPRRQDLRWVAVPRTLSGTQVLVDGGRLALSRRPGEAVPAACTSELLAAEDGAFVGAQLTSVGVTGPEAWTGGRVDLRYFDEAREPLPGGDLSGARQLVAVVRGDTSGATVREPMVVPGDARWARVCVRLDAAEGRVEVEQAWLGLPAVATR